MKLRILLSAMSTIALASHLAAAQAPAGTPAGANGQCNDGSYSMDAKKQGACRGHKGIKTWFFASAATPAAPAAKAAPSTPAPGSGSA